MNLIGALGWQEILIGLLVILLLFGARKLPDLARSIGSSVNEFKKGLKDTGEPPANGGKGGDAQNKG